MNSALLLIGSGCLVCLLPLALYFLFLAYLNNRRQPTLLTGRWDLACLFLGLSGFFIVGGPVLLSAFDSTWRSIVLEGDFGHFRAAFRSEGLVWSMLGLAYFCLLGAVVTLTMHTRRRVDVIYNCATVDVDQILMPVLERLALRWRKRHGIFEMVAPRTSDAEWQDRSIDDRHFHEATQLEAHVFPTMRHVTLRWTDEDPVIRRAVGAELGKMLDQVASPPNPAGGWFLTASFALFFVMLLWMGFLIFWMIRSPS